MVGGPSEVFASSGAAVCGMRPHGYESLRGCLVDAKGLLDDAVTTENLPICKSGVKNAEILCFSEKKSYFCSNKKDFIMDVTIQSVNLQLPSSDIQFLKELANRMGWKTNTVNSETSKTELDKAILDVKKGNVKNFDTLEEMMNYLDA
nr:hypothetical protein [Prevotella sp.]